MANKKLSELTTTSTLANADIFILTQDSSAASRAISYANMITELNSDLTVSATVAALNDITNVTITSNTSGEILKWNGSAWINNTLAEAGISATGHSHTLSDVSDVTSTAAEVNILDGATLDVTELNYVDGVTSAIQTQLDAKAPIANPTFTGEIGIGAVNVSETELGILEGATLTTTEINYVDGVTSAIQTQIDTKGTMSNVLEDTTPQLGGDLDYNSNGLKIDGQTVGGSNGNAVYLSGSNTWSNADSSAEATCKDALGIRISATDVLLKGVYTTSGLTAGALYYVSETAGAITSTAPTTSLSIVRPIAYALTTTELYVFPSGSYVENA